MYVACATCEKTAATLYILNGDESLTTINTLTIHLKTYVQNPLASS
jgi:hypothetical protein